MTEELSEKIAELLWNPPKQTYESTSGGIYQDIDRWALTDQILALIQASLPALAKEAGYVKLDEDQTLPGCLDGYRPIGETATVNLILNQAGWRKVELEE